MDFEHDVTKLAFRRFSLHNHYTCDVIPYDFTVWWSVWDHGCEIMLWLWFQIQGSKSDRSRCSVGFGWPARAYPHRALFLNQNARLFSISDFKTCCFIIWFRRDLQYIPSRFIFSCKLTFWPRFGVREVWMKVQQGRRAHWHDPRTKLIDFVYSQSKFRQLHEITGVVFMDPWSTSMISRYDAGIMDFDHGSMKIIRRVCWGYDVTHHTENPWFHRQIHDVC